MFVLIASYIDILSPFVTCERVLDSEDAAALPLFYFLSLRSSKNLDLPCNIGYLYFSLLLPFSSCVYKSESTEECSSKEMG